jgi:glycosyltransferase involved in cell wall biosynthesis
MWDAYGGGGVARTVLNLAGSLAQDREVEVVTVFRRRDEPLFPVSPRVRLTVLQDLREPLPAEQAELAALPGELRPRPLEAELSRLTEGLLRHRLETSRQPVVISTRPSLHLAAARWGRPEQVKVAQEHVHHAARFANPAQERVLRAALPGLDGCAVLTAADAVDYGRLVDGTSTEVRAIPNALPWPVAPDPAPLESEVIVTAGRLELGKGHARLVRAFAGVAQRHPHWQLHVYGSGRERAPLLQLVGDLGLEEQVHLKGYTTDLRAVLAEASVYALASHSEGFAMTLIEAMSVGLPPVAMDCPRGPREIIRDGHNGLLVPDGDEAAMAAALTTLVEDARLRRRLGATALEDAHAYALPGITVRWDGFIHDLRDRRAGRPGDLPS